MRHARGFTLIELLVVIATIVESPDGPPDYEVARDADVTVLMWSRHKVKVNHAFKGELTQENIRTIVGDIPKVLGE